MRKTITLLFFISLLSTFMYAQTYYVDFENGSDSSDGLSQAGAWKHCPGDPNAIANPKNATLSAGNLILFKGGVHYRGIITTWHSGSTDAPITYKGDGWGLEKAVIDGTEILEVNWQKCKSIEEAAGNPNWQNIYYTTYSGTLSPFTSFFQDNKKLYLSQSPNMSDPFWEDNNDEFYVVQNGNITRTSIMQSEVLNQPDSDYYNGAYTQVWCNPNSVYIKKINSYNPGNNTIYFDSLSQTSIYGNRDQYFSIVNHIDALDRAGEYVVDEANSRIYLWPYKPVEGTIVSYGARSDGFTTTKSENITIEGFQLRGMYSDGFTHGIWIQKYGTEPGKGIVIRNNELSWIRSKANYKGAIETSNLDGAIIENNKIEYCQRQCAMLLGSKNLIVRNNYVRKVGYKGLWFMNVEGAEVTNNTFEECEGTHGNAVSIFTSKNILFANNFMGEVKGEGFTFSGNTNMVFHNNIIYGAFADNQELGSNVVRHNGGMCYGYIIITNNTIMNSSNGNGIGGSFAIEDSSKGIIKNNITDGGPSGMKLNRSHNIYTDLNWTQQERYGWSLMETEFIQRDRDSIFVTALDYNYQLSEISQARKAGIDPNLIIPQEIQDMFPDYDFSQDYYGNTRGKEGFYDIGAIKYSESTGIVDNETLESKSILKNYPNPFSTSTTITFEAPKNGHYNLTVYDIAGREIAVLLNCTIPAGKQQIEWDGTNSAGHQVGSGVYFYQLKTKNGFIETKKMMLIK
ncbi:MAG: right-handed parallel beta-helix repeat-containing protein [Bacteroidales bacterium]